MYSGGLSMSNRLKVIALVCVLGLGSACTSLESPFGMSVHISVDANVSFGTDLTALTATALPTPTDSGTVAPFEVWANKGWQDTHVIVRIGQRVIVTYISGLWTEQQGVIPLHDSASTGGLICGRSDCAEPAPDAPKGSLIGRVGGGQIVAIGTALSFVSDSDGTLALRINDADTGLYDNIGSVVVQIVVN
jgi:hypothetical protein